VTQVSAYIVLLDQTDPQLAVWPESIYNRFALLGRKATFTRSLLSAWT